MRAPPFSFAAPAVSAKRRCFILRSRLRPAGSAVPSPAGRSRILLMKRAFRHMKHFAVLPQNMKRRSRAVKRSLDRLHVFLPFLLEKRQKNAGRRDQEDRSHPGKLAPVPPRRGWGACFSAKAPSGGPGGSIRRTGSPHQRDSSKAVLCFCHQLIRRQNRIFSTW